MARGALLVAQVLLINGTVRISVLMGRGSYPPVSCIIPLGAGCRCPHPPRKKKTGSAEEVKDTTDMASAKSPRLLKKRSRQEKGLSPP
jgi:hypothetical protein